MEDEAQLDRQQPQLTGCEVDAADADNQLYGVMQLEDAYGRPVLLFNAEWKMNKVIADSGEQLQLRPFAVAPDVEERRRAKRERKEAAKALKQARKP
mgnify:CR=1 FL=1